MGMSILFRRNELVTTQHIEAVGKTPLTETYDEYERSIYVKLK